MQSKAKNHLWKERQMRITNAFLLCPHTFFISSMFPKRSKKKDERTNESVRWYSFWCAFLMQTTIFVVVGCISICPRGFHRRHRLVMCVYGCSCKSWKSFIRIGNWLISLANTSRQMFRYFVCRWIQCCSLINRHLFDRIFRTSQAQLSISSRSQREHQPNEMRIQWKCIQCLHLQ